MRSVGLPQFDGEDVDGPAPVVQATSSGSTWIPIVGIVVLGIALVVGLTALDGQSADSESATTPTTSTPTASADNTTTTTTVPAAPLLNRTAENLANLGSGASVFLDEFDELDELHYFAIEDGFVRFDSNNRYFSFSDTGGDWTPEGISLEHGMPLAAIETAPDGESGVIVFRSADGIVFAPDFELDSIITVPALPEAQIDELVLGAGVGYVTVSEPTVDGGSRYSVLKLNLVDEFGVESLDFSADLGEERNFERLRNGVVLADGTIVSIATDRANSVATLVEFGIDGLSEVELDDTNILSLTRTAELRARGTDLIAIDRDSLVYSKRLDQGGFEGSTLPVHPVLSKSNAGVLASIELLDDQTILRVWPSGGSTLWMSSTNFTTTIEITLDSRIEPVEIVELNTTEALLATTTTDGERWLIGVPFEGSAE